MISVSSSPTEVVVTYAASTIDSGEAAASIEVNGTLK